MYMIKVENPMWADCWDEIEKKFDSKEKAQKYAEHLHDTDYPDADMVISDENGNKVTYLHAYQMDMQVCPVCGREDRHYNFEMTTDCHGINYRAVVSKVLSKDYGLRV